MILKPRQHKQYKDYQECGSYDPLNPINAELNPICHILPLLGAHHILHVSSVRVNTDGLLFTNVFLLCIAVLRPTLDKASELLWRTYIEPMLKYLFLPAELPRPI